MQWYEKLQKQCPSCKKYLAEELTKETKNYLIWTCRFCGNVRKTIRFWAIYKNIGNKIFLKTSESKKFQEVELVRYNNFYKVEVVRKNLFNFNKELWIS